MDERYSEVNQMAAIILNRPAATARQIAEELGFAQQRSVYYWLRKAGFDGLKPFRTAVLTGAYPVAAYGTGAFKPRATHVAEVPLTLSTDADDGVADYVVTTRSVSREAFAVAVVSDDYTPLLEHDDIVIVDPKVPIAEGDLVFVKGDTARDVFCRAYPGRNPLYVHPVTGRPLAFSGTRQRDDHVVGKVIGLQRNF